MCVDLLVSETNRTGDVSVDLVPMTVTLACQRSISTLSCTNLADIPCYADEALPEGSMSPSHVLAAKSMVLRLVRP